MDAKVKKTRISTGLDTKMKVLLQIQQTPSIVTQNSANEAAEILSKQLGIKVTDHVTRAAASALQLRFGKERAQPKRTVDNRVMVVMLARLLREFIGSLGGASPPVLDALARRNASTDEIQALWYEHVSKQGVEDET